MKEKYCEKYFENTVKPKHLRDFEAKTPNGNIIKGYISRKPNKYLGSLIITHITEKTETVTTLNNSFRHFQKYTTGTEDTS